MGIADWMRVIDVVGGLAQISGNLLQRRQGLPVEAPPAGALETRLAGVVVAALKEAFDRDRARMDLERAQVDAERQRAEVALAAELRRQASERSLGQLRLILMIAVGAWMLSAVLAALLPGMRAGVPRGFLGVGWLLAFGTLGCGFAGWQRISAWTAGQAGSADGPESTAASAAPWMLLTALAAVGASLLLAL